MPLLGEKRLPVYLLLDCSGSMSGEPIAAMGMGLNGLLGEFWDDPQAMETVWLSVIAFGSFADQVVPLVPIERFTPPRLEAAGTSAFGDALLLLLDRIDAEVGYGDADWIPIVFVFSDGNLTDSWLPLLQQIRHENRLRIISCGVGSHPNLHNLKLISDTVLHLSETQPGSLVGCLRWEEVTRG